MEREWSENGAKMEREWPEISDDRRRRLPPVRGPRVAGVTYSPTRRSSRRSATMEQLSKPLRGALIANQYSPSPAATLASPVLISAVLGTIAFSFD